MMTDHDTETTPQKLVAEATLSRHTARGDTQQDVSIEREATPDADQIRTTARRRHRKTAAWSPPVKPEYKPFADALCAAMDKLGINASEVARRMWGTTVDNRGRTVAKNRDRIGHYRAGTSYPDPDNLEALARAVEVPVETLAIEAPPVRTPAPPRTPRVSGGNTLTWTRVPNPSDEPKFVRMQFDQVLEEDVALRIYNLLRQTEQQQKNGNGMPEPGTVIDGGKRIG